MSNVYVLIHVKHIFDKALGHPVDSVRWHSVHPTFEDASAAAVAFTEDNNLISEIPLYVWWRMSPSATVPYEKWWMSNEFGAKKDVGNSMRITMRVVEMEAVA